MKRIVLAVLALTLAGCNCSYSDGSRVGVVSKFSRKGLLCKTWEGEMNVGGFRNRTGGEGNTTVVANIFEFSVANDQVDVIEDIWEVMESGKRVRLTYHQIVNTTPCAGDSGYLITKVEVLE